MKICKYCSTRVEDSNIKCPACGAEDFYHVIEHNEINEAQKKQDNNKDKLKNAVKLFIHAPKALKMMLTLTLAIIFVLLIIIIAPHFSGESTDEVSSKTVELGFKKIGEMATQAAFYTNVQATSDYVHLFSDKINIPLTKKQIIYSYDGVIKAGFDFGDINYEIDDENQTIKLILPAVRILSNELYPNSLKVYDETKNIFNTYSITEYNEGIGALKAESEEKAIANGLLDNSISNAKEVLTGICNTLLPDYQIIFITQEE